MNQYLYLKRDSNMKNENITLSYVKIGNRAFALISENGVLYWRTRSFIGGLEYTCVKSEFKSLKLFIAGCSPHI